ncbi:hypothetical protein PAN31117_05258 [Pandoraea anapnoica]|uniref:Uncharacterized protein n=1 Tax=Pandoraea anapnoica TaxID=2508301 RepID=A0A5E5AS28_9BURK|nr:MULTISPECIES: hypothetical protein [Pandoraea]VVE59256.1 hypothetical protein PIN31009_05473 [Pandoraea iniqua]VVE75817.1 hypothetical protein PAN31117_05258 [Pandoraea anapnoica]
MVKQPASLAVAAWFMIAMGTFSLVRMPQTLLHPSAFDAEFLRHLRFPSWASWGADIVGAISQLIIGWALLTGRAWARKTFVATTSLGFATDLIDMSLPMWGMLVPQMLVATLLAAVLYQPSVTAYFASKDSLTQDTFSGHFLRKMLAVGLFIISGFCFSLVMLSQQLAYISQTIVWGKFLVGVAGLLALSGAATALGAVVCGVNAGARSAGIAVIATVGSVTYVGISLAVMQCSSGVWAATLRQRFPLAVAMNHFWPATAVLIPYLLFGVWLVRRN